VQDRTNAASWASNHDRTKNKLISRRSEFINRGQSQLVTVRHVIIWNTMSGFIVDKLSGQLIDGEPPIISSCTPNSSQNRHKHIFHCLALCLEACLVRHVQQLIQPLGITTRCVVSLSTIEALVILVVNAVFFNSRLVRFIVDVILLITDSLAPELVKIFFHGFLFLLLHLC